MGREGYHIGIVMYKCTCAAIYIVVGIFFSDVKAKISHPSKYMLNRPQKCMSSFFFLPIPKKFCTGFIFMLN